MRLPRQIRDPLLNEMEDCIVEAVLNEKIEKLLLSDVLFISALLSNIMYSSHMMRFSPFHARAHFKSIYPACNIISKFSCVFFFLKHVPWLQNNFLEVFLCSTVQLYELLSFLVPFI